MATYWIKSKSAFAERDGRSTEDLTTHEVIWKLVSWQPLSRTGTNKIIVAHVHNSIAVHIKKAKGDRDRLAQGLGTCQRGVGRVHIAVVIDVARQDIQTPSVSRDAGVGDRHRDPVSHVDRPGQPDRVSGTVATNRYWAIVGDRNTTDGHVAGRQRATAPLRVIVKLLIPSQEMSLLRPVGSNRKPSACVTKSEFPDVPHATPADRMLAGLTVSAALVVVAAAH